MRLLLVDDDPIILELNRMLIKRYQPEIEIIEKSSASEALEYIKEVNNYPDAILLDINMPIMNGWDFLNEMNSLKIQVPVFMLTSSIDYRDREKAAGFSMVRGFLEKPLFDDKIEQLVSKLEVEIAA